MDFDTTRLRSFLHVAERGTVAAAAEELGFTGPAVSQHITKLEAQLGVTLFERVGGRLALSGHGSQLVPIARDLIDLADRARRQVANIGEQRRVIIAGFASAIRTIVLPAMERLPDVQWELHDTEDDDALRSLRLGTVDVALVQSYGNRPEPTDERLLYTELTQDSLRLVTARGRRRSVGLVELASSAWLVNGSGTRCESAANEILASAGIVPRVVGRIADTSTLLALVAAGHGATIAPERMLDDARAKVTVSRIDLGIRRTIFAVRRAAVHSANDDVVHALHQAAGARPARTN